jgi:hypothetical protein
MMKHSFSSTRLASSLAGTTPRPATSCSPSPPNGHVKAPLLQGLHRGQVPKEAFSHQILLESKELPDNPAANMPTLFTILYPTAMEWHFFGGPSARHQYNGTTISIFLPAINTMALQFPFFGPPSIQWHYNFLFSAHHQYNGNTTIFQKSADIDDWRYISTNIAHLWSVSQSGDEKYSLCPQNMR